MKKRFLLIGALILLLAFLAAGCATSFQEWSGEMPNETGAHVKGYDYDQTDQQTNQAIRPLGLTPGAASQRPLHIFP